MKNMTKSVFAAKCLIFMMLFVIIGSLHSQSLNGIHLRKGVWGDPPIQYKFKNVAENVGYLAIFPIENIKQKLPNEVIESWDIEYRIFTSIEDAELAMVERLDMSSLYLYNTIDSPLPKGQIGDNCWYQLSVGAVQFLRNNAFVAITPKIYDSSIDTTIAEWIAREVDTVIIKSEKVDNANLIPAPRILSVEILSGIPKNWEDTVEIKVNASDQESQKLYYRKYAAGFAIVSETGLLTISFNKNTDLMEDSTKARVKIWVWNEDYLTSSVQTEIPF